MSNQDLLKRFNDITELFKKLYYIYQDDGMKIGRTYNSQWWPSHFLTLSCDIEVEVCLSTAKFDYKHEEDDYAHALGRAAMEVLFNSECELSDIFNTKYIDILFEKKMFFEDQKRYVYPHEVYEHSKGGLRNFIYSSYVEDSWFSHRFFIEHMYAYKDKPDMYLSYNNEILISEDEFNDLMNRMDQEVDILKNIYREYYLDVFEPIYRLLDPLMDEYQIVRKRIRDNKQLEPKHFALIEKILEVFDSVSKQYADAIDEHNIESYIRTRRP